MHYKQNNKESKTYVQGLRQFGNTLPRGIKGILKKNGYNFSEIVNKWKILVGEDISNCAFPKSIKRERNSSYGTLMLNIKRGEEINIEYSKNKIINNINSYFGYKLINQIKLQTLNFEEKNKKNNNNFNKIPNNSVKKITKIKNKNVRSALFQLIKTLKND